MSSYKVGRWTERICWNCGFYISDSPAFQQCPQLFENMVRESPNYFIRKFLQNILADESLHEPRNRRRLYRTLVSIMKKGKLRILWLKVIPRPLRPCSCGWRVFEVDHQGYTHFDLVRRYAFYHAWQVCAVFEFDYSNCVRC